MIEKERYATENERVKFFKFYPTPGEKFSFEMNFKATTPRLHPIVLLNQIHGEAATLDDSLLEFPTMAKFNMSYGLDAVNDLDS